MYPDLTRIKEVSIKIATKVAEEAYKEGMAATYPEPEDKESHIRCSTSQHAWHLQQLTLSCIKVHLD